MKKAQISNEFMLLIGVVFIFFLIFVKASAVEMNSLVIKKESRAVEDVGYYVQNEIIIATSVADGYSRTFNVPDKHNTVNYSIAIVGNYLILDSSRTRQHYEFIIPDVNGTIVKGDNTIERRGGVIYLN